ncbi:MAG: hypothetical protein Q7I98_00700, partial [Erysipelotrichaceae bacterium]|nr:hypothetical protein [Erysipelotrichaceae bacterium]
MAIEEKTIYSFEIFISHAYSEQVALLGFFKSYFGYQTPNLSVLKIKILRIQRSGISKSSSA